MNQYETDRLELGETVARIIYPSNIKGNGNLARAVIRGACKRALWRHNLRHNWTTEQA